MKSAFTGHGRIAHHVTSEDTTVTECLKKHFRLAPERASELMHLGAIYSDKRRVFSDRRLKIGTYLRIHLSPKRFPTGEIAWDKTVIHHSKDFLVANKPPGIPSHATVDNHCDNLLHQLREKTGENLLITQRLDTQVGGLIVLAKNPDFQRRFNFWLSERKIIKKYRGLTNDSPPPGLMVHYMEPSERAPRRVSREEKPLWQKCELTIHRTLETPNGYDSEIELHTGRTHQIRAQLAEISCPIHGDKMYGSQTPYPGGAIALFSSMVSFQTFKFEEEPHWKTRVN